MKKPYAEPEKNVDKLVLEYLPLVKKIAGKLSFRIFGIMDADDLAQTGVLGLIDAAQKFDPARDNKFKTYAEFRIRGAMLDELRARDWVPRSVRDSSSKIEKTISALRNQGIDSPSEEQIAQHLQISEEDFQQMLSKSKPMTIVSFDDLSGFLDDDMDVLETLSDPEYEIPEDFTLKNFDRQSLADAISQLNEKEQTVLALCYQEDMNLKEVAEILSITESRVSQIRTKAIATLRSIINDQAEESQP